MTTENQSVFDLSVWDKKSPSEKDPEVRCMGTGCISRMVKKDTGEGVARMPSRPFTPSTNATTGAMSSTCYFDGDDLDTFEAVIADIHCTLPDEPLYDDDSLVEIVDSLSKFHTKTDLDELFITCKNERMQEHARQVRLEEPFGMMGQNPNIKKSHRTKYQTQAVPLREISIESPPECENNAFMNMMQRVRKYCLYYVIFTYLL